MITMKWNLILNIKRSHYNEGYAFIDSINIAQLSHCLGSLGCSLSDDPTTQKIHNFLLNHMEMNCFGKISDLGNIILEGFCGFPTSDECVQVAGEISKNARHQKISDGAIFVEY